MVIYLRDSLGRFFKLLVLEGSPFSYNCQIQVFLKDSQNQSWIDLSLAVLPFPIKTGSRFLVSGEQVVVSSFFVNQN
jgi:hypothetical protein